MKYNSVHSFTFSVVCGGGHFSFKTISLKESQGKLFVLNCYYIWIKFTTFGYKKIEIPEKLLSYKITHNSTAGDT